MGLGKWWLTHGPGSPGACAKAITQMYLNIRARHPDYSKSDCLLLTGVTRKRSFELIGRPYLSEERIGEIVEIAEGDLSVFAEIIIVEEDPEIGSTCVAQPDIYHTILEVISETVRKELGNRS